MSAHSGKCPESPDWGRRYTRPENPGLCNLGERTSWGPLLHTDHMPACVTSRSFRFPQGYDRVMTAHNPEHRGKAQGAWHAARPRDICSALTSEAINTGRRAGERTRELAAAESASENWQRRMEPTRAGLLTLRT